MKYMLLTYGDESAWNLTGTSDGPHWSHEDVQAMVDFMQTEDAKLAESGELVYAEGLADPATGKTVRYTNGAVVAIATSIVPTRVSRSRWRQPLR